MDSKKLIWLGLSVGGFIGSLIPMLWGAGALSFSSIIFSALGAFAGIWAGYKLGQ
ncbi:MAG: hypothetical protein WCX27_03045 [Candidatus Paceibacterota bacterium]|jgi:hypothetical protein